MSASTAPRLPSWNRVVLKVGSALVAPDARGCSTRYLLSIAQFVNASRARGRDVVLVSSGAVAAGLAAQGRNGPGAGLSIPEKQALAAIGQPLLMQHWSRLFDDACAQVLLTYDDVQRRTRYVNAQNTIAELLARDTIPIVNENDTVATEELQVGDNDNLAAYVAVLADADLLVICSDVDGLYDADPRTTPDAERIPRVPHIDETVMAMAGGAHHATATGGMRTKIEAAQKATDRGIDTVIVNGTKARHLNALRNGTVPGTLFCRAEGTRKLSGRKHWMLHALPSAGTIVIDAGAAQALRSHGASLLPSGILDVKGSFAKGDAVDVVMQASPDEVPNRVAKGMTQYSAADLRRIQGRQSHAIAEVLDHAPTDYAIHRDDLVVIRR